MNNGLIKDVSPTIRETVMLRIEDTLKVLDGVQDRTTKACLDVLMGLKYDYEYVSEFEKADKIAQECLDILFSDSVPLKPSEKSRMVVSCYDTRARCGDFESFCLALEWNRPLEKQFYIPRRKIFNKFGLIQAFQDVADGNLDFLCINMPPRSGKSTTGLFFIVFMACLYPDRAILGNGHSTSLTQSFYKEVLNIFTNPEYRLAEIFPTITLDSNSSEYSWIDLNSSKRFHTMMFKSVDGGTTGLAEASNLLYCDDLVKDVETANNPDRLEKLFYTYTSTIQDRKVQRLCKDGVYRPCPEIHINTPWSIHDVTSRLIRIYGDDGHNPRVRIISVPCYDSNGESNFLYDYGKGFDVEYYKQLEASEDPVIFSAKYLMQPIERDGRPFTEDMLSYYYELPDGEPDRIVAYNDVAHGGEDYMSMPIGYVYGNDIYIHDVLFVNQVDDNGTRPMVCQKLIDNAVTKAGFEENNGGKLYADIITQDLKRRNYRCNITTHKAPTNRSKLDRIMSCQSEIKGIATEFGTYRLFFKAKSVRGDNAEYNAFMKNLHNWSQKEGSTQKRQHDDAPDSLAGLITNVLNGSTKGRAKSINASGWL
jgi:hypothetical protein